MLAPGFELLVTIAVCVGVGMAQLLVHFQQRDIHERQLAAKVDHHREVVADYEATVHTYRAVTQLEQEDIGASLESALR